MVKKDNCTMTNYVIWAQVSPPRPPSATNFFGWQFELSCAWYSECGFAHLCVDCSKDNGPSCLTTKCALDTNVTSAVATP